MAYGDDMNPGDRVQLTRIEGTINIVNERLGTLKEDVIDLKLGQTGLSTRVSRLETDSAHKAGERAGFVASGKLIHTLLGGGALGIVALLFKAFGG